MASSDYLKAGRQIAGSIIINNTTYASTDSLVSFKVSRTAPSDKMFGFILSEALEAKLLSPETTPIVGNTLTYTLKESAETASLSRGNYIITNVEVGDTSKEIKISAEDTATNYLKNHKFSELSITYPTTAQTLINTIITACGGTSATIATNNISITADNINLTDNDTLYEILVWLLEITGTIAYINSGINIFHCGTTGNADFSLTSANYFTLDTEQSITPSGVVLATQLGDNYIGGTQSGYYQTIWDNPILALRDDTQTIATNLYNSISTSAYIPYTLEYRGNPYYYPNHLINISLLDNTTTIKVRLLTNELTYNGGLSANAEYTLDKPDSQSNQTPVTVGESIAKTFATVDRVNNEINIQAGKINANSRDITTLKATTDSLTLSVATAQSIANSAVSKADNAAAAVETAKSEIKLTTDSITASVSSIVSGDTAVSNVQTTCATLDKDGLTVSQEGKHTETIIDAEGLTVKNTDSDEEMLEVVVEGGVSVVRAQNFESNSYIKVGYSRFEDYTDASDIEYTGVFWLGA